MLFSHSVTVQLVPYFLCVNQIHDEINLEVIRVQLNRTLEPDEELVHNFCLFLAAAGCVERAPEMRVHEGLER